jgi:hypothetical protein
LHNNHSAPTGLTVEDDTNITHQEYAMLTRIPNALIAAVKAFRASLIHQPVASRPGWDNGINYDVPTFLRRSAAQST